MSKICLNHFGIVVAATRDGGALAQGIIELENDSSPCPFGSTAQIIPPPQHDPLVCQSSEVMIQNDLNLEKKCWAASEDIPPGWTYLFGGGEVVAGKKDWLWVWLLLIAGVIVWRVYSDDIRR